MPDRKNLPLHHDPRQGLPELTPLTVEPPGGPAARMQRYLLQCAIEIMNAGRIPSVSEVAEAAQVSRATAYRYFPTRSKLIAAVTDYSLGPVRSWRAHSANGKERINELFAATFPRFEEYEVPLRAAMQVALEHEAMQRAGLLKEDRYRRGYRRGILAHAAEPLRATLGQKGFERLLRALSLVYGIEPYVIVKDMWGGTNAETSELARWVAQAIVDAAVGEANTRKLKPAASAAGRNPPRAPVKRRKTIKES